MGMSSQGYLTMSAQFSSGVDFMHVSVVIAMDVIFFFVRSDDTLAAAAAALGSLNKNVFEQWQ